MKRMILVVIILWIVVANFEIVQQKPIDEALYCMEYGNKHKIIVNYNREEGCFTKTANLNDKVRKYYDKSNME